MTWQILQGDAIECLRDLEAGSVQTCVTSPPYWGLRDYGTAEWEGGDSECDHLKQSDRTKAIATSGLEGGKITSVGGHEGEQFHDTCGKCGAKRIDSQLGLEPTPEQYVENLVAVFREVRRVLRDDGTVWLNLGDSYATGAGKVGDHPGGGEQGRRWKGHRGSRGGSPKHAGDSLGPMTQPNRMPLPGLKPKDLCGIPWRVAFALQADGWWLRSDIIWAKPNPMPESVTDRPTRAHEYIFLLSKSARYFYDADAIREENVAEDSRTDNGEYDPGRERNRGGRSDGLTTPLGPRWNPAGRNKRSVWTVTTQPYPEAHFATFPPKLVEPCILASSPPKCSGRCPTCWSDDPKNHPLRDKHGEGHLYATRCPDPWHNGGDSESVVLDPFCGSGTTGLVALRHNRSFIGIELNPEYCEMARNRIRDDAPLFNIGIEA